MFLLGFGVGMLLTYQFHKMIFDKDLKAAFELSLTIAAVVLITAGFARIRPDLSGL